MTLSFDAFSFDSTTPHSWTHTPSGTPRAAIVFISQEGHESNQISGVFNSFQSLHVTFGLIDTCRINKYVYQYFRHSTPCEPVCQNYSVEFIAELIVRFSHTWQCLISSHESIRAFAKGNWDNKEPSPNPKSDFLIRPLALMKALVKEGDNTI